MNGAIDPFCTIFLYELNANGLQDMCGGIPGKFIYIKEIQQETTYEDIINDQRCYRVHAHNLRGCEINKGLKKISGQKGIHTHDLCDTGAVFYQLSYQTNWELATLWVPNIPEEGEEYKGMYENPYIWTAENDMKIWLIIAVMHTAWAVVKLKPDKIIISLLKLCAIIVISSYHSPQLK